MAQDDLNTKAADVLERLQQNQQAQELSIIKLGALVDDKSRDETGKRSSDVSPETQSALTPASLESDLAHYKELFSKLRFSYLEQVTKERFIRSIVDDPPLMVEHQENVELEEALAVTKAELKELKTEVADLVVELGKRGRELCRKNEHIQLQTTQLKDLPAQIVGLESSIEQLKASQEPGPNPSLNMPLEKTLNLVEEREKQRAELDRQLEQLQSLVPRKTRELERLQSELQPLEVKRLGTTASAREAKRRKEEALGGIGDDLEERGRWWRGVEGGLKGMLGVENDEN
ncbi:hypothetical protein BP6252_05273 [Coleophoma cylindrospora]|uniref:Kinetochore protein Sos7 coiled-coil domain-containing protein n=1 Tax=Coleophoma cylindrospora TaxID=1849047 RepID=A0A3D8RTD6_9HELO|nr:hypothetical protein BP6252_05273 [Coleophoma cylindrospora]